MAYNILHAVFTFGREHIVMIMGSLLSWIVLEKLNEELLAPPSCKIESFFFFFFLKRFCSFFYFILSELYLLCL